MKILALSILILPTLSWGKCVPVADWSGKIIFPETRSADGGVDFLVENSPDKSLIGKKFHLRFGAEGSEERKWFDSKRRDVKLGVSGRAAIEKEKNQLPVRLDGLKDVSPLESLAASRDNDLIRAELLFPSVSGNNLTISREPVLLDGTEQCLIKFVKVNGDEADVRFYDQKTKSFSENIETVSLQFKPGLYYPAHVPKKTLAGIENHKTNTAGWNAFGVRNVYGRYVVEAIESYSMLRLHPETSDDTQVRKFKNRLEYWKVKEEDKTRSRQLIYKSADGKNASETYKVGDKFLLTHAFGSFNDHGKILAFVRGHASMGTAEIVSHPITGEEVIKPFYKQVFGHWAQGTFAASWHYHAYAGNLYRGWMFHLPMTEVLYPAGPDSEEFLKDFDRAFDNIIADYRTGFGSGYAKITLMASCVHDTGNTFIGLLDQYVKGKKAVELRKSNPELLSHLSILKSKLGKQVLPDPIFRTPDLQPANIDSKLSTLAAGRKNMIITVPRNFQDEVLKSAVKDGKYPVIVLQTVQAGDDMEGVIPRKPNRINSFTGALLGTLLRGSLGKWIEF